MIIYFIDFLILRFLSMAILLPSILLDYDIASQNLIYHNTLISFITIRESLLQAVPARITWRRPLWSANLIA